MKDPRGGHQFLFAGVTGSGPKCQKQVGTSHGQTGVPWGLGSRWGGGVSQNTNPAKDEPSGALVLTPDLETAPGEAQDRLMWTPVCMG